MFMICFSGKFEQDHGSNRPDREGRTEGKASTGISRSVHTLPQVIISWFLYSLGVLPVYDLKKVLNVDFELKPESKAMASIV